MDTTFLAVLSSTDPAAAPLAAAVSACLGLPGTLRLSETTSAAHHALLVHALPAASRHEAASQRLSFDRAALQAYEAEVARPFLSVRAAVAGELVSAVASARSPRIRWAAEALTALLGLQGARREFDYQPFLCSVVHGWRKFSQHATGFLRAPDGLLALARDPVRLRRLKEIFDPASCDHYPPEAYVWLRRCNGATLPTAAAAPAAAIRYTPAVSLTTLSPLLLATRASCGSSRRRPPWP